MPLLAVNDLPTPALVIDAGTLQHNLTAMAEVLPGNRLRPHVKAHKSTELAAMQYEQGHTGFTCATVREVIGLAEAGWGHDLLLANEVLDPGRLSDLAHAQRNARITIAVDSERTIDAAASAGLRSVLIDVNVGLPRCGCAADDAGRLADLARSLGLEVRGVMGYEGHLMAVGTDERSAGVASAMALLALAHDAVGGDIVSTGGTGTFDIHAGTGTIATEVQAGSYLLMDSHYTAALQRHVDEQQLDTVRFRQACWVVGTVISSSSRYAVADVGLKALGMDHGNSGLHAYDGSPLHVIDDAGAPLRPWFYSDEHVTFSPPLPVGARVAVTPAHIDPTMAMHHTAWLAMGNQVIDQLPIDLRNW
jgi:D-serine deaminase-like pyridoxal phosphate-dependent protein